MICNRCGREQPSHASPCPACDEGYHILTSKDERPIQIVDAHGVKVFSFSAADYQLARDVLRNLNMPASRWEAA